MSHVYLARIAVRRKLIATAAVLLLAVSAIAADRKPGGNSDENAIRASVQSYVDAFNRGDAKAVAAHWGESGEWVSPAGQRFQGRPAIEKAMTAMFAANKGVRIEVLNPSIRIVSPDAAIEEGSVRVTGPAEPPSESTYLAVHVKKDGQWKLASVRETEIPEAPPADSPLQELAWLAGEWIDQSPEAAMEATVTWTKNKTFLNYAFKASAPGMDDLEGTQIIGWDPAASTIRSWMFDSDGGFGEGTWSRKDKSWVVKFSQVLSDGRKASATNIYTLVDGNTIVWKSIGRKLDGEFLPNVDEVKIVRKSSLAAPKESGKTPEKPRKREAKK